jgi:hypothetical protein
LSYNYHKELIKLKDNIYLHKGLLDQYIFYQDKIYKNIIQLDNNNVVKNIYITGHGMGAAIATMAAAILGERYKNMYLVSCFTFDSPMIGNKEFKKYFNRYVKCNYRITINDDQENRSQYYHVSDPIKLETESIFELSPAIDKKHRIVYQLCTYFRHKESLKYVVGIDEYILRLRNIRNIYKKNMMTKSSPSNSSGTSGTSGSSTSAEKKEIESTHNET